MRLSPYIIVGAATLSPLLASAKGTTTSKSKGTATTTKTSKASTTITCDDASASSFAESASCQAKDKTTCSKAYCTVYTTCTPDFAPMSQTMDPEVESAVVTMAIEEAAVGLANADPSQKVNMTALCTAAATWGTNYGAIIESVNTTSLAWNPTGTKKLVQAYSAADCSPPSGDDVAIAQSFLLGTVLTAVLTNMTTEFVLDYEATSTTDTKQLTKVIDDSELQVPAAYCAYIASEASSTSTASTPKAAKKSSKKAKRSTARSSD